MKKLLAITAGEPAGIGYDILIHAAQAKATRSPWLIFADPDVLTARAQQLDLPIHLELFHDFSTISCQTKTLTIWPTPCIDKVVTGVLNVNNVPAVMSGLKAAADCCLNRQKTALVTLPIHKGIINQAGYSFSGHTEFFAQQAGTKKVVMMLAAKNCRVALVTMHLPLSQVAAAITVENIVDTITIVVTHIQQFCGIQKPRLLIMGLNPHAGEAGHLGREEVDIIEPALELLRTKLSAYLIGPLAADTLFQKKYLQQADAIVAMYHDQGLAPLKALYFGDIVNITCGLPFIRTSVDHGVALDIAGSGAANSNSFNQAIAIAEEFLQ